MIQMKFNYWDHARISWWRPTWRMVIAMDDLSWPCEPWGLWTLVQWFLFALSKPVSREHQRPMGVLRVPEVWPNKKNQAAPLLVARSRYWQHRARRLWVSGMTWHVGRKGLQPIPGSSAVLLGKLTKMLWESTGSAPLLSYPPFQWNWPVGSNLVQPLFGDFCWKRINILRYPSQTIDKTSLHSFIHST